MPLKVDFHVHTSASKDSLTTPERLVEAIFHKGIDRVVVTDHNSITGARQAQKVAPHCIIVGEEIMTTHGELLAAFVEEEIPAGLDPQEAVRRLRRQGAFISVSHPFDFLRSGYWGPGELERIVDLVDAVEVFNARCLWKGLNRQAQEFAVLHGLGGTAGSDAHSTWEVGRAVMVLPPFENADGLRCVIRRGELLADASPFWVRFFSRYASLRKRLP